MIGLIRLLLNPYYINIGLLFLWAIVILNNKNLKDRNRIFVAFASMQWILISGLRHITIGGRDVYISYNNSFYRALDTSWMDAGYRFIDGMFYGAHIKDPGYMLFEKLVGLFTGNYQVFLLVVAIVFMVPFGKFVYKNSKDPFMSFLIYSTLFYSFFSLTGFRQTIATALVVLLGYELIKQNKLMRFILLTCIAFTIHKSSIAFLPFYFLANWKVNKGYWISVSIMIPMIFIFRTQVISLIGKLFGYESYTTQFEGAGSWTFTFFLLSILGVTMWKYKGIIRNNSKSIHYINALVIAVLLVPLTFVDPSAMRVVQYFSLFIVLLVPEIIKSFNRKDQVMVYLVSIFTLVSLLMKNNPHYLFFWQGW